MRNQEISKIEERDLEEVKKLLVSVFNNNISYEKMKEYYNQSKDNENVHLYGYYINDILVGMIMLNIAVLPSGKKPTIWNLAVKEEYRNQGIATKLINKVESILEKEEFAKKIWMFSGVKREDAHKLYRKLGYNEYDNKAFYKKINQ